MKHNVMWGLLHGGTKTKADWTRGTGMMIGYEGRDPKIVRALPEKDESIRGWMTETLLKAALMSSRAPEILSKDRMNTYATPLKGPSRMVFTRRTHTEWGVTWDVRPRLVTIGTSPSPDPNVYERSVQFAPDPVIHSGVETPIDETITFIATGLGGTTSTLSVPIVKGRATFPFGDGDVTVRGLTWNYLAYSRLVITIKSLPSVSPWGVLSGRLGVKEEDLPEAAGDLCMEILGRVR